MVIGGWKALSRALECATEAQPRRRPHFADASMRLSLSQRAFGAGPKPLLGLHASAETPCFCRRPRFVMCRRSRRSRPSRTSRRAATSRACGPQACTVATRSGGDSRSIMNAPSTFSADDCSMRSDIRSAGARIRHRQNVGRVDRRGQGRRRVSPHCEARGHRLQEVLRRSIGVD